MARTAGGSRRRTQGGVYLGNVPWRVTPSRAFVWLSRLLLYALITLVYHHRIGAFFPTSGDEPHYLMTAASLVHDGDFNEANNYRARQYREFGIPNLFRHDARETPDRAYLGPEHGIGFPLLVAIPYRLLGAMRVRYALAAVGVGAALVLAACLEAQFGTAIGTLAGRMLITLPTWQNYSAHVYPEVPGGALALICLTIALRSRPGRLLAVICALCLAYLPFLYIRFLGLTVFLAWISFRNPVMRRNAWFLAPLCLLVAAELALTWQVYRDAPVSATPAAATQSGVSGSPETVTVGYRLPPILNGTILSPSGSWERFWRLFFDRTHGIAPEQPLTLLSFWSIPFLLRRGWEQSSGRPWAVMAAGVALYSFAFALNPQGDGECAPGRYLCATLPFVVIFAFHWALRGGRMDRVRLYGVLALWAVSAAIDIDCFSAIIPTWHGLTYYQRWFPAGWSPATYVFVGEWFGGNSASFGWLLIILVLLTKAVHREISLNSSLRFPGGNAH